MAGKTGSVDIMAIGQEAQRLYLSDHTTHGVDVVDLSGPAARYLKTVPVNGNPNGLVVAGDLKLIFTGNVDATVSVIDVDPASPSRDTVVATLDTKGFGADELTYDLHILVRFELERELIDGTLEPRDAPAAWNDRVRSYLERAPGEGATVVVDGATAPGEGGA